MKSLLYLLLVYIWTAPASPFTIERVSRINFAGQYASFALFAREGPFFEDEVVSSVATSNWNGVEGPSVDIDPADIPSMMMTALKLNDMPTKDAGLRAMWEFAGDTTRFVFRNNQTDFIESAHETAENWPTSFYGVSFHAESWSMESKLNRVGGPDGWIATQVMKTVSSDGRMRRWQWELRKKRQPPNRGSWFVETIGSSDRKGNFEADN